VSALTTECNLFVIVVFKKEPAIEVATKPYSLEPDIATGWIPKMKIIGPIPLNFDNIITDHVVNSLLQHFRLHNYYRVVYLGMGLTNMSEQVADHTTPSKCMSN
jgi:hypothetical protein